MCNIICSFLLSSEYLGETIVFDGFNRKNIDLKKRLYKSLGIFIHP